MIDFDGNTLCHIRVSHQGSGRSNEIFQAVAARLRADGHHCMARDLLWGNNLTEAEAGTISAFELVPFYDLTKAEAMCGVDK